MFRSVKRTTFLGAASGIGVWSTAKLLPNQPSTAHCFKNDIPVYTIDGVNVISDVDRVQSERFDRFSKLCQETMYIYKSDAHKELINAVMHQSERLVHTLS